MNCVKRPYDPSSSGISLFENFVRSMTRLATNLAKPGFQVDRKTNRLVVAIILLLFLWVATADAADQPRVDLSVSVGLADQADAGSGVSVLFRLFPLPSGSDGLPGVHTLQVAGNLGSLDLTEIPRCRPVAESPTSGCSVPSIGTGRVLVFRQFDAAGAAAMKLHGTVQLYSGGQSGRVSVIYAWVSFRRGAEGIGTSFVIPMTLAQRGHRQSELIATVPKLEGGQFGVKELLLSVRKNVRIGGRSIPIENADCKASAGGVVRAKASFYYYSSSIEASAQSKCAR
jgi:hypothetical protein